jgi:hypothetical protein
VDSTFPTLYAGWVQELVGRLPPPEPRATCLDCAMLPATDAGDNTSNDLLFFRPSTKCCTYQPHLPNFLAGALLSDEDPALAHGRTTLLARIDAGENVTPLGVGQPPGFLALYRALAPTTFGSNDALRCPHLTVDGLCGVWRHRNAICATWFCKHDRGAVAETLWNHLREWLREIERDLAAWCVLDADLPPTILAQNFPAKPPVSDDVRRLDRPKPRSGWGAWDKRRVEFYLACAEKVRRLTWEDVARLCSPSVSARATLVRDAFARVATTDLPERLVAGPLTILKRTEDGALVSTYRGTDPLELSSDALTVLAEFDGRPTKEVLRNLADEKGLDVDAELVGQLHDFALLRNPEDDGL